MYVHTVTMYVCSCMHSACAAPGWWRLELERSTTTGLRMCSKCRFLTRGSIAGAVFPRPTTPTTHSSNPAPELTINVSPNALGRRLGLRLQCREGSLETRDVVTFDLPPILCVRRTARFLRRLISTQQYARTHDTAIHRWMYCTILKCGVTIQTDTQADKHTRVPK